VVTKFPVADRMSKLNTPVKVLGVSYSNIFTGVVVLSCINPMKPFDDVEISGHRTAVMFPSLASLIYVQCTTTFRTGKLTKIF
jgi:hypothetical protein